MLQYDKRSSASAKNRTKNFLAINKSQVSKNKSNHLPKINPRKEDQQRRNKFNMGYPPTGPRPAAINRDKPPRLPPVRKVPSAGPHRSNTMQHQEETVTITRGYLEEMLKKAAAEAVGIMASTAQQQAPLPQIPQTTYQPAPINTQTIPVSSNGGHGAAAKGGVYDHSQVPGLGMEQPFQSPRQQYPDPTLQDGPSPYYPSPPAQDSSPSTYHRGTTNRPLHPAMRSQISFGVGPGWGGDTHQVDQQRDEAKKRWLNELGEQVKSHNTAPPTSYTIPVSKPNQIDNHYSPRMPINQQQLMNTQQRKLPMQGTPVRRDIDEIDVCQMKANNVQNPTSVAGRGGGGIVSVGLQEQMSPREFNEKKRKDLEHRDYLLAQMEEKRRLKEEEKMKMEREAAIEERRLAIERERLARDFEMEKEMQKRKKMEEAKRIAHMEERIKLAEKSAITAKEDLKKSKRLATAKQQHSSSSNTSSKHVAFRTHSKHAVSSNGYSYEDEIPPLNTDEMYLEGVKASVDLRSPSLHTIPISTSQSDKSLTSPRNSHDKYHTSKSNRHANQHKSGSVSNHHHHHNVMASNSQVSLYSSSSEEPATKQRRPKPKPEAPSSGKKTTTGPPPYRESRIPRKSILRKQLAGKNQNKSESESDGNKVPAQGAGRRTVTANGHQSQQHQVPNSVAKKPTARPVNRSASHKGQQRYTTRPQSNDSEMENARLPKNRRLTKAHSVPHEMEVQNSLPVIPHTSSPPVPAVARQLKEKQNRTKSPPVPAVTKRLKESPPVAPKGEYIPTYSSPPVPAVARQLNEEQSRTTSSPPIPAVARCLQDEQFRSSSPPVPAVARRLKEEQQTRTSSPPVPAVARRIAEEKAKQNGGSPLNNGVKAQEHILPDISVTTHDSPAHTNSPNRTAATQEFKFPPVVTPQHQSPATTSHSSCSSSVPSLPPVSTTAGVIGHQPHIDNQPQTSTSEPLPPINQPHFNSHQQPNSHMTAQPLPPIPQDTTRQQPPQQQPPQLQYNIYSQTTIPSFEPNQSIIAPPLNTVVQYVRAPSYPPNNDQVKPAVRRQPHREEWRAQRNAVCVLPTIQEVRSQEEMKESASNKSVQQAIKMCHSSGQVPNNNKELAAQLLKLKQGIRSHLRSFSQVSQH